MHAWWFMAHGSRLMAHGQGRPWEAHGSWPGAGQALGTQRRPGPDPDRKRASGSPGPGRPLAMSHEPPLASLGHEPWAMNHEPSSMHQASSIKPGCVMSRHQDPSIPSPPWHMSRPWIKRCSLALPGPFAPLSCLSLSLSLCPSRSYSPCSAPPGANVLNPWWPEVAKTHSLCHDHSFDGGCKIYSHTNLPDQSSSEPMNWISGFFWFTRNTILSL